MKKIKLILIMLLLASITILPHFNVAKAEATKEIYYPNGISDYVDLNNLSKFATKDDLIFYTKDNQNIYAYDKSSKQTTKLEKEPTQGTIKNMLITGEYLFVFANKLYVYDFELNRTSNFDTFNTTIIANCPTVHYLDC